MSLQPSLRPDLQIPQAKHVLIIENDDRMRSAALQCLSRLPCMVVAPADQSDPQTLARHYRADVVVLGAGEAGAGDASSRLRESFDAPVAPLFRPSVHQRRRIGQSALGSTVMLGLTDCRMRISQLLETRIAPADFSLRWGGFTLKLEPGAFAFEGRTLSLTRVQSAILSVLMAYGGQVVSRSLIEELVFDGKPKSGSNFISVHVSRLRRKLRESGSAVRIENIMGEGYVLFWNQSLSPARIPEPELIMPAWSHNDQDRRFACG